MKCDWLPPQCDIQFPPCFKKYPGKTEKNNPGNFSNLHYLANRIKPKFLDGVELDYAHRLSNNKIITANWMFSHNLPSGFRFGGMYTTKMQNHLMQTPFIHANINPTTLSTNVGLIYYPLRWCSIQAQLQRASMDAPLKSYTSLELFSKSSTLTANFYDVTPKKGRGTLTFLRSVTQHIALGSELLLEWTDPKAVNADIAFAARYRRHAYSVAGAISRQGADISVWHRIHERLQFASFWAYQRKTDISVGTICYQWDFKDAFVRGMVDSNLSVGILYSRYIDNVPLSVAFSLYANYPTNRFVFGLKFTLDPSGLRRGG